jgi:hypothetical protein
MRVTVLLRNGDSWRVPVKSPTADVRWLVDEVARRLKRRKSEQTPLNSSSDVDAASTSAGLAPGTPAASSPAASGAVESPGAVSNIVGVRRANSAILELDDKLFDHCVDGEQLTALYVSDRELVDGFTDLIRSVASDAPLAATANTTTTVSVNGTAVTAGPLSAPTTNAAAAAAAASASAAAASPYVVVGKDFFSSRYASAVTPLGTPVKASKSSSYQHSQSAADKLNLGSSDDSSDLLHSNHSTRSSLALPTPRHGTSLVNTLLRSTSMRLPVPADASETNAPDHVLSVIASTDGDRVDVNVASPMLTAKDVIREVLLSLYGQVDERRQYGLATLDGALLGPAMPIIELFRANQRRARVVLVFPPDDDSETDVSESLGVALHDVQTLKSSLHYGSSKAAPADAKQPQRSASPDVESCLTEEDSSSSSSSSSSSTSSSTTSNSPIVRRASRTKTDTGPRPSTPAPDPLLQRAAAGIAKLDAAIVKQQQHLKQATSPLAALDSRQQRSNSGGPSLLERRKPSGGDSESSALDPRLRALQPSSSDASSATVRSSGSSSANNKSPVAAPPAPTPPADDNDGTTALLYLNAPFEEVEICEFLGKGGSTSVFRGVVRGLSVAVKVFDLSFSDRQDRESVQREIEFMQTLRHRHIIGFLGVHQIDKTVYLYMEYFMATLHHLIATRREAAENSFSVMEVASFAGQIARALKYLHTRSEPIVHRDLKSENVFIYRQSDKQFVVKIGDFGESVTVERKSIFHQRLKRSVCNVGTTEFRAPELWGAKAKGYNTKIDIWAFGMVLFELLTLDIPYRREGLNRFAIPAYIAEGNRPQLPPDLPTSFAPIVKLFRRCSEAAPSGRPTAKELVASIDKLDRIFFLKATV